MKISKSRIVDLTMSHAGSYMEWKLWKVRYCPGFSRGPDKSKTAVQNPSKEIRKRMSRKNIKFLVKKGQRRRKSHKNLNIKTFEVFRCKCSRFTTKTSYVSENIKWTKTIHIFNSRNKILQSGISPAPCVLCQCTSPLPPLQYICKALH